MSKYYCLVAGLPELTLEDSKLSYTVADFKTEFYPFLTPEDRKLMDLFYYQFDNVNVLRLLGGKEAEFDNRGIYPIEELQDYMGRVKDGEYPLDEQFPSYLSSFLSAYFEEGLPESVLLEDYLAARYYAYAMEVSNRFVASWFEFNLTVNNVLVALTARKYKMEVSPLIVGHTALCHSLRTSNARDFGLSGEIDEWNQILKISETEELLEREKKIDRLRWNWLEDKSFFHYFTIERLFVFLLRLEMIERWNVLDKEKGNQLFRSIIAALKDEVHIPAEFR